MINPTQALVVLILYRIVSMIVGAAFAWMGYRLLRAGLYEVPSEIAAEWGDRKFVIRQAAPGTVFALFGAVIVGISLFKGIDVGGNHAAASIGDPAWQVVGEPGDTMTIVPQLDIALPRRE